MTALSDWLHRLPGAQVRALREFRASARAAYPDDPNPIAKALEAGEAGTLILAMPRDYMLALDH